MLKSLSAVTSSLTYVYATSAVKSTAEVNRNEKRQNELGKTRCFSLEKLPEKKFRMKMMKIIFSLFSSLLK